MRHTILVAMLSATILGAATFACAGKHGDDAPPADDPNATGANPASTGNADHTVVPNGSTSPPGAAGTGANTGLPCDVQAILENRCIACHNGGPASPPALLDYDDLMAPSKTNPAKSMAVLSLERMKDPVATMPPKPAVPVEADEIQTFSDWVAAGTPKGEACTPGVDGGAGVLSDGGPAAGATVCTSGKMWTSDEESSRMHPGAACLACHQQQGGPNLRVAGTVYATAHEPIDCIGAAPPPALVVEVTDATGKVVRLDVNSSGNFDSRTRLKAPYRAAVKSATGTRAMQGAVTSGDCNSCHTEQGANGAPGRIMAP